MASADFSKSVLEGMRLHGVSEPRIAEITGLSKTAIKAVLSSKRGLTDGILARIEEGTGRSVGQLAALTLPSGARPLTYIFDELAGTRLAFSKKDRAKRRA